MHSGKVRFRVVLTLGLRNYKSRQIRGPDPRLQTYSARSAVIGSTDAARRAGRKLANNAEAPKTPATQRSVVRSHGGVPKSILRISEAAMIAHTITPAPRLPRQRRTTPQNGISFGPAAIPHRLSASPLQQQAAKADAPLTPRWWPLGRATICDRFHFPP